ncbi:MAG: hypothetical protein AUJ00_07050 [Gemmatimonadetes bacterium 13_1_40CM_3_70_6]|nr:MAG: hypothetical protein AUJ00_07050 [Gemmatimonadetes bacterium 13_1_40CM_3_70_6]
MILDPTTRSLLRLLAYYVVLVAGTFVLAQHSSVVRDAVSFEVPVGVTPRQLRQSVETGAVAEERAAVAATTALAMLGALALMIPVAWIYMLTKRRQGWDPSVVQTVILLPLAIAGIVAVVRNSLALAFSLAGLAAAVRFRNTLKDTKDAVYIFLAVAVGLAAGVQALALGLVVSGIFNVTVVALWSLNVGDIYAGEPRPHLTGELRIAEPDRAEGILLVRATPAAQAIVEATLQELTKTWKPAGAPLTYVVRLKKKTTPAALVAAITQRAAEHGATAEFRPLPA